MFKVKVKVKVKVMAKSTDSLIIISDPIARLNEELENVNYDEKIIFKCLDKNFDECAKIIMEHKKWRIYHVTTSPLVKYVKYFDYDMEITTKALLYYGILIKRDVCEEIII